MESQKFKTTDFQDCFECRITGTAATFAIGCYLWYNSTRGKNVNSKVMKLFLRSAGVGSFYFSAARWFYFPPFDYIKNRSIEKPGGILSIFCDYLFRLGVN